MRSTLSLVEKHNTLNIYEHSTWRYVRLNALNVLNVHGPCFNAPKYTPQTLLLKIVCSFLPCFNISCLLRSALGLFFRRWNDVLPIQPMPSAASALAPDRPWRSVTPQTETFDMSSSRFGRLTILEIWSFSQWQLASLASLSNYPPCERSK